MKIRIKGNSIRLRLTRSEVDDFGRTGYVEERTEFGNNLFLYALRNDPEAKELSAKFIGIKITMHMPSDMALEWTTTEIVGYSNTLITSNGKELFLLVEKDFKCIDAPEYEDQSDNYEHPTLSCAPMEGNTLAEPERQHSSVEFAEPVAEVLASPAVMEGMEDLGKHPLLEDDEPINETKPTTLEHTEEVLKNPLIEDSEEEVQNIASTNSSPAENEDIGKHPLLEDDESETGDDKPKAS